MPSLCNNGIVPDYAVSTILSACLHICLGQIIKAAFDRRPVSFFDYIVSLTPLRIPFLILLAAIVLTGPQVTATPSGVSSTLTPPSLIRRSVSIML